MRIKSFTLLSGSEDRWGWCATTHISEYGGFKNKGVGWELTNLKERYEKDKKKVNMRIKDKNWVHRNIPSSIAWYTQIHHDWNDGARMYLLSKGEHIKRNRRDK